MQSTCAQHEGSPPHPPLSVGARQHQHPIVESACAEPAEKGADLPLLFVDIDGVINAFPKPTSKSRDEYLRYDVRVHENSVVTQWPVHVRPKVIDFVNRVHRDRLAEVRWLTMWGRHARSEFAPAVGLDDFAVAGEPPPPGSWECRVWLPTWWKLAVVRQQAGDRRFVFVDDDLGQEARAILEDMGNESLLITPFATPGMEDWQLDKIEAFLNG